jgi:hypothetical protein
MTSITNTPAINKLNVPSCESASRLRVLMMQHDEKVTIVMIGASKLNGMTDRLSEKSGYTQENLRDSPADA